MEMEQQCSEPDCSESAMSEVTLVQGRKLGETKPFCTIHGESYVARAMIKARVPLRFPQKLAEAVCCEVCMFVRRFDMDAIYVELREAGRLRRWTGFYCGPVDCSLLMLALGASTADRRRLMYDGVAEIIELLGGNVDHVFISGIVPAGNSFFAEIVITGPRGQLAVETLPTDAIGLAIRAERPIFISKHLLNMSL